MKKYFIVSLFITLVSLAIAIYYIVVVNEQIPANWDALGNVRSYASPLILLIYPAVALATSLLLMFLPKIDPKGKNIQESSALKAMIIALPLFMIAIQIMNVLAINNASIFTDLRIVAILVGILMVVIGYYTPSIKPNYMFGIRTAWTLHNEKVWTKTHEASGKWFVASGVLFFICAFLKSPWNFWIPMAVMMAVVLAAVIYSYILYKNEKKK